MRFAIFIFIACTSVFSRGIAENSLISDIRVNLNQEKLRICEDGIFLMTDAFGVVALNNLQIDERGYYTICPISRVCANCKKQLEIDSNECDYCGSQDVDSIGMGENKCDDYLTTQAILCAFLNDPSQWEGKIFFCGSMRAKGVIDDEGNQSVSIELEKNKGGKVNGGVTGTIKKDKDGKTTASAEVEIKIDL